MLDQAHTHSGRILGGTVEEPKLNSSRMSSDEIVCPTLVAMVLGEAQAIHLCGGEEREKGLLKFPPT